MVKFPILHQSANVLPVQKTEPVSVIGKAIRFLECVKPAVSVLTSNANPVILLLSELMKGRTRRSIKLLLKLFHLFRISLKSFTVDNGKEFAAHKELVDATGMKVYFCDPYSPWQRATNENTNGLIRQFFPKGTSFADITDDDLQYVVDLINNRPRKRLNFLSPFEVLKKFFQ